ncbi:MAG TPA: protein-disulfide reductase DsbD domain-containing protein [Candidatus Limnocylindrales bacterium]|nr:protein-disulfide reductase DsbD domain-containing protein [Candidatus Limnocylindrales bacterium]
MRLGCFGIVAAICIAAVGAIGIAVAAAQNPPMPATSVVKPQAYVSLAPVPRGKEFQVAIVVSIARGYHMNSHKPLDPYLIPTTVTPQLPAGFALVDTLYPNGKQEKFPFSPDKALDVYSGSVTLRLKLTAQADAALGAATIPITLRYQACNDSSCLPPVKVPVDAKLEIAAASATAKPLHPEIFASPSH